MVTTSRYLEAPRRLRAFVRAHETSLVLLAALIGTIGGLVVAAMSAASQGCTCCCSTFEIGRSSLKPVQDRAVARRCWFRASADCCSACAFLLLLRWRPAREIDPIEANALHGGRMSFRGSVIVALQTIWSSGVGASVGLEAGYTQLASGLAASIGPRLSSAPRRSAHHGRLRRRRRDRGRVRRAARRCLLCLRTGDRRLYAGEPDTGRRRRGHRLFRRPRFLPLSLGVGVGPFGDVFGHDLAIAALLGVFAALVGIGIMRGVALCETR